MMTSEEVLEMATQAGMLYMDYIRVDSVKQLEAFAKLVAAKYEQKIQDLEDMITELQERQE